jgi:hypothetical protein
MTSLDSYITLGRSGLRVSPLTLGTMTFGEDWGWGASPENSEQILAEYLDRCGNVVDTANVYTNGHSEKIVGDFFAARPGLRERALDDLVAAGGRDGRPATEARDRPHSSEPARSNSYGPISPPSKPPSPPSSSPLSTSRRHPSLNFPAAVITEMSPMFGFGGATVDGIELPVWPQLLTSTARY